MDECAHSPVLIHHAAKRGHNHPPSSLRAIRACLDADARVIEVDISPLADGDFLLFHGQHLEDGTDGSGLVAAQTTSEVSRLHYTRSGGENAEPVGMLSQAMELLLHHSQPVELQLDLKPYAPLTDSVLMDLLRTIEPVKERIRVTSPADWALRRLRVLDSDLPLGFDPLLYIEAGTSVERNPHKPPFRLGEYGYWDDHPLASRRWGETKEYLAIRAEALWVQSPSDAVWYLPAQTLELTLNDGFDWINFLHGCGAEVDVWTLNPDRSEHITVAQRMIASGIDRITTTDAPAMAAALDTPVLF